MKQREIDFINYLADKKLIQYETEEQLLPEFDEYQNNTNKPVELGSIEYDYASVLCQIDPVRYRMEYNDYISHIGYENFAGIYATSDAIREACQKYLNDPDDDMRYIDIAENILRQN